MKFISAVNCAICVGAVNAASFRAPVVSVSKDSWHGFTRQGGVARDGAVSKRNSHRYLDHSRRSKKPIRADWSVIRKLNVDGSEIADNAGSAESIDEDEKVENVPLWDWVGKTYTTQVSIGNPPQPFNMLLSISDTETFVPAMKCYYGCNHLNKYDSSSSNTFISYPERTADYLLRLHTVGQLAQDSFEIGGEIIKNQTFGQVYGMVKHAPKWGNFDGMLGLAPSNFQSDFNILNPFQEMVSQDLLNRNLFSLKLPSSDEDPGEILFGDVNPDLFVGDLKTLPIIERPEELPRLKGRWVVPATSISVGFGYVELDGYVASLETDFPLMALPEDHVHLLNRYLGMREGKNGAEPPSIDCAKRGTLENLTITLGQHDFTISPWEYTIEVDMGRKSQRRCVSAFYPLPGYIDEKYIILGSTFLKAFYGVFDLDEVTVSLGRATSPKIKKLVLQDGFDGTQELKRR